MIASPAASLAVFVLACAGSSAQQGVPLQSFGPSCGARLLGSAGAENGATKLELRVDRAFPSAPVALLFGSRERRATIPGSRCVLLTDPAVHVPLVTNAAGEARFSTLLVNPGTGLYAQALPIDIANRRFVASNGAQIFGSEPRFGPSACPPNQCSPHQMIIGCDGRKRGPTSGIEGKKPWNMVGRIYVGGSAKGTGTLIGSKFVLTAAHPLLDVINGQTVFKPGSIGFALGQFGKYCFRQPFGMRYVKRVFIPAAYNEASISASNKALDYAVLELAQPLIGGAIMQVQNLSWSTMKTRQTTAIGYPYDKSPEESAWYARGSFLSSQPDKWMNGGAKGILRVTNDGAGGMSGGPLYVWHNGKRKLVAVFIGSPEWACEQGHVWASRMTSSAVSHITNAKFYPPNGNKLDFFWKLPPYAPPLQPDVQTYCGY